MRVQRSRLNIQQSMAQRLALASVAGLLIATLTAGDAISATGGMSGGGGPRISTPSIGSVGPRSPNFRTPGYATPPRGNPDMGKHRFPRDTYVPGVRIPTRSGIVVLPSGPGGPPNYTPPPVRKFSAPATPPWRRLGTGVPPAGEQRYVPDEVVIEIEGNPPQQAATALAQRFRLTRIESQYFPNTNSTIFRW